MQKNSAYRPWFLLAVLVVGGFAFVSIAQEYRTSTLSVAADYDQDGLSNKEEALYGTDPNMRDTDGDGYSDGVEVQSGYDPLVPAAQGDRLIGLNAADGASGTDSVERSRHLTNELRTRVAGIAFDMANGEEVSLDDVSGEIDTLLEGSLILDNADDAINVEDIRIKKQDYADLSDEERKEQISKDVSDYVSTVTYILSLYAPAQIESEADLQDFAQEVIGQMYGLQDDYANMAYFTEMLPRAEKFLSQMKEVEVPEVALPLHIEGLQLAHSAVALGESVSGVDLVSDPASAAVIYGQGMALLAAASTFSDDMDAFLVQYTE